MEQYHGISALREIHFDDNYFSDFTYSTLIELLVVWIGITCNFALSSVRKLLHSDMLAIYLEFDELRVYCKLRHTEAPLLVEYAILLRDLYRGLQIEISGVVGWCEGTG